MKNAKQIGLMFLTLAIAVVFAPGCQSAAYQQGDATGQSLTATYSEQTQPPAVVVVRADGTAFGGPIAELARQKSGSPVVSVVVMPGSAGKTVTYAVAPQTDQGDKIAHTRIATWAGASPGEVTRDIGTQKHKSVQNPLPAVSVDATGVHAAGGGGSSDDAVGLPWYTRLKNWVVSIFRSLTMTLVFLVLLPVLLLFVAPLIFPAAAPICQAILHAIGHVLTFGISSVVALGRKLKEASSETTATPSSTSTPPAKP